LKLFGGGSALYRISQAAHDDAFFVATMITRETGASASSDEQQQQHVRGIVMLPVKTNDYVFTHPAAMP